MPPVHLDYLVLAAVLSRVTGHTSSALMTGE
jgi:hypothetical protein